MMSRFRNLSFMILFLSSPNPIPEIPLKTPPTPLQKAFQDVSWYNIEKAIVTEDLVSEKPEVLEIKRYSIERGEFKAYYCVTAFQDGSRNCSFFVHFLEKIPGPIEELVMPSTEYQKKKLTIENFPELERIQNTFEEFLFTENRPQPLHDRINCHPLTDVVIICQES